MREFLYPLLTAVASFCEEAQKPAIALISFFSAIPEKGVREIIFKGGRCLDACCFESSVDAIVEEIEEKRGEWEKESWYIERFLDPKHYPSFYESDGKTPKPEK